MHIITDNFLKEEEFAVLRDSICHFDFPWFFSPIIYAPNPDLERSPGLFIHPVYMHMIPRSHLFDSFIPILKQLNSTVLGRIIINLNYRLPEPYYADFHTDTTEEQMDKHMASQWTTSILYINTNNGYTELEDGTKVESVANRLVSYPLSTRHRFATQTDEQTRILINFTYLRRSGHKE